MFSVLDGVLVENDHNIVPAELKATRLPPIIVDTYMFPLGPTAGVAEPAADVLPE